MGESAASLDPAPTWHARLHRLVTHGQSPEVIAREVQLWDDHVRMLMIEQPGLVTGEVIRSAAAHVWHRVWSPEVTVLPAGLFLFACALVVGATPNPRRADTLILFQTFTLLYMSAVMVRWPSEIPRRPLGIGAGLGVLALLGVGTNIDGWPDYLLAVGYVCMVVANVVMAGICLVGHWEGERRLVRPFSLMAVGVVLLSLGNLAWAAREMTPGVAAYCLVGGLAAYLLANSLWRARNVAVL